MEKKSHFQIQIDSYVANILRETINSEKDMYLNRESDIKINRKTKKYRSWDLTCAIMDRLDDTVEYLNSLQLNTGEYKKSAVDFFNFINQATVIIDCVDTLAELFNISLEDENQNTDIFNMSGLNKKGTDKKYFEYIRSICSVHPVDTSYYREIYQESDFECSPFVSWNQNHFWQDPNFDIFAVVYTNEKNEGNKTLKIKISEVFEYIKFRYSLLEKIISEIKKEQESIIISYIETPIKRVSDFGDYTVYLENLKIEEEQRFGTNSIHFIEFMISLVNLKISNSLNIDHYNKFCAAMMYAIEFQHNALQNRSYEGFENNGIEFPQKDCETTLLKELYYANSRSKGRDAHIYKLEKIADLNYDSGNVKKGYAYEMLNAAKPFLEKYVSFEDAAGDFEHYALVQVSLYFECLGNNCLLNKNIPNDLKFRDTLLTDEHRKELLKEQE